MLLNQMIQGDRALVEGLRPHSEIESLVQNAIPVTEDDPASFYKVKKVLGKGAQGEVYLAERKSDGALFALKCIKVKS